MEQIFKESHWLCIALLVKRDTWIKKGKKMSKVDHCFSSNKLTKWYLLHFLIWSWPIFCTEKNAVVCTEVCKEVCKEENKLVTYLHLGLTLSSNLTTSWMGAKSSDMRWSFVLKFFNIQAKPAKCMKWSKSFVFCWTNLNLSFFRPLCSEEWRVRNQSVGPRMAPVGIQVRPTLSHFQNPWLVQLSLFHTFTTRLVKISPFYTFTHSLLDSPKFHTFTLSLTGSSNFHIFTRRLVPGTRWRPLVSCAQVPRQIQVFVSFEIIFLMTMKTMMVLVKFDSLSCVLKWQNYPQGWAHIWLLHIHVYLLNAHHCSAQFVFVHVLHQIWGLAIWIILPVYDLS